MTIQDLVALVVDNSLTVVLIGYFLYKDWKFNESITSVLGEIQKVLVELRTWHAAGEDK